MSETVPAWLKPAPTKNTTLSGNPSGVAGNKPSPLQLIVAQLEAMTAKDRSALAASLKAAGYKVPASGAVTPNMVSALGEFDAELKSWQTVRPELTFQTFMAQKIEDNMRAGGSGSGGPRTQTVYSSINETDAASLIQDVFADQLGRYASQEEIAKYTSRIRNAQAKAPTTTSYSADGSVVKSSGGINEQQFLIDQIAGTDDAKRNRALDAYTILNELMGGGQ